MVPNVNGDISVGKRDEHLVIQVSEIANQYCKSLIYTDRGKRIFPFSTSLYLIVIIK